MKNTNRILVILVLAALVSLGAIFFNSLPQSNILRNITSKLSTFYIRYPQQKVYLHTDKNSYSYDERVWIKAYLLNATHHTPDASDNNLYIELVNPSGHIVQTKIVRMEDGLGHSDFSFRDTVPEGFYMLRSYTNWMRNLGEDYFFTKDIYVSNPIFTTYATREAVSAVKKSKRKNSRKESRFDVSFLPEGGVLLSGISNRVAFKAINDLGKSIEIQGVLKDNKGREILTFNSGHKGMGTFLFTPEKGSRYTADVSVEGQRNISFPLPETIDMGININANHDINGIRVNVTTNIGSDNYPPNTIYYFIAHVRGIPVFTKEIDIRDTESLTFNIPKASIPTGIAHLTLFNHIPAPISERLIFINQNDPLFTQVQSDKTNYSKREKVNLKIRVSEAGGNPVSSNFSLSVSGADDLELSSDIVSHLLLTSDLKGNIENPGDYFMNYNKDKENQLDLLMLTQGWRKFKWSEVMAEQRLPFRYHKERGLEVIGKITRDFFALPLRDIKVQLTIMDEFNDAFETRSDHRGNFFFQDLYYMDTVSVRIEATRASGRKNLVILIHEMEQPQLKDMHYQTNQMITKPGSKGRWINNEEPKEEDPFEEQNTRIDRIHSEPGDVIIVDDKFGSYQNVLQIIQGRVPGVNVVRNRVIIRGVGTFYGSTDPLYLIDGIPVDPSHALSMNPLDIERIEILKGPEASVYGIRGGNGVIAIYTKRGKFMIRGRLDFKMLGYATPSEFYSPKYEAGYVDPYEDDRQTLFWLPELKTDQNGNAEVSFFTSDIPGKYTITFEGISRKGVPGTGRLHIHVR